VPDKGGKAGNFDEASASCILVCTLAKGARMGYLAQSDEMAAKRGWAGIQKAFAAVGSDGLLALNGTVKVVGLGGKPYRSGRMSTTSARRRSRMMRRGWGHF